MNQEEMLALENILDYAGRQSFEEILVDVEKVKNWLYQNYCKDCKNFIGDGGVCACDVPF